MFFVYVTTKQNYSIQQKKHNDPANKHRILYICVYALYVCVCKIALILIDLNCGRAIYIGAPESQSMQPSWNVNILGDWLVSKPQDRYLSSPSSAY